MGVLIPSLCQSRTYSGLTQPNSIKSCDININWQFNCDYTSCCSTHNICCVINFFIVFIKVLIFFSMYLNFKFLILNTFETPIAHIQPPTVLTRKNSPSFLVFYHRKNYTLCVGCCSSKCQSSWFFFFSFLKN